MDDTVTKVTAEIGTTGDFHTIILTGDVRLDIAAAVEAEHPCDSASCDIATAMNAGCPLSAASLLEGTTETPLLDAVIRHYGVDVSVHANHEPDDWNKWVAYHTQYAHQCDACSSYTYGDNDWTPAYCNNCGHTLPKPTPREQWIEWLADFGPGEFFDAFMHSVQGALASCAYCGHQIALNLTDDNSGLPGWQANGDFGCFASPETDDRNTGPHVPLREHREYLSTACEGSQ